MNRINFTRALLVATVAGGMALSANAATIIETHSSGLLNGNFNPGGAIGTSNKSTAVGLQGTNSAYSTVPGSHVWTFSFTPGPGGDIDNFNPAAGAALTNATHGGGEVATGMLQSDLPDGGTGDYRIFVTWPWTDNIKNPTTFTVRDSLSNELYTRRMNQNVGPTWFGKVDGEGTGFANGWGLLATVNLTAGETYTLTMASDPLVVSQRVQGVMFEAIPEPGTYAAIFGGLALLGAFVYRRRVTK